MLQSMVLFATIKCVSGAAVCRFLLKQLKQLCTYHLLHSYVIPVGKLRKSMPFFPLLHLTCLFPSHRYFVVAPGEHQHHGANLSAAEDRCFPLYHLEGHRRCATLTDFNNCNLWSGRNCIRHCKPICWAFIVKNEAQLTGSLWVC